MWGPYLIDLRAHGSQPGLFTSAEVPRLVVMG